MAVGCHSAIGKLKNPSGTLLLDGEVGNRKLQNGDDVFRRGPRGLIADSPGLDEAIIAPNATIDAHANRNAAEVCETLHVFAALVRDTHLRVVARNSIGGGRNGINAYPPVTVDGGGDPGGFGLRRPSGQGSVVRIRDTQRLTPLGRAPGCPTTAGASDCFRNYTVGTAA